ncbi:hypothetical protein VNI00_006021 [Paramarasmius palmivorus]|uniref:C2H2-type domain-containing protein n=1 Tax=Paramarasmius palmivorus TaxID=297713 RepID=A0AAW0DAT6_9AGAR
MTEATDIPRSNPLSTHTGRSRSQTVPSQFPSYLRPHPYRRPPKDGIVECRNGLQDTQGDQYSRPPQPQAAASSNRLSYWPRPDYGCLVPSNGDINSPRPTCNVFNGASGTMEHNMLFDFASARLIDHRPGPQSQPPNGGTFATTDSPLHLHSPKSISMQVNGVAQLLGACQLDNPNASNTIHVEESALAVDRQFLDPAVQSSQGSSYNQHTLGSFAPTDGTGYPSTERNPWPPDRAAQMAASPDTPWSESLQTPVDSPGRAEAGSGNDALSHNPYQTPGAPQVYELHSASEGHLDHLFPHVAKPSVRQASKNRRRSDAKLYPCEFCGQTLTAMHNLKFHINSHFGIKNHKCTFCDASFNTPSDRRRHEKTCTHNGNSASPAT